MEVGLCGFLFLLIQGVRFHSDAKLLVFIESAAVAVAAMAVAAVAVAVPRSRSERLLQKKADAYRKCYKVAIQAANTDNKAKEEKTKEEKTKEEKNKKRNKVNKKKWQENERKLLPNVFFSLMLKGRSFP